MVDLKMYDYQKEIVESKEEEIICNWSRRLGKDFTLVSKILKDKPKEVIWVGNFNNVKNKFDEVLKLNGEVVNKIQNITTNKDRITIEFFEGMGINVQKYYRGCKQCVDLLVFNEMLPYKIDSIEAKQIISMISTNNYDKKLQKLFPYLNIKECGKDTILKYQLMSPRILENKKQNNRYYDEIDILSIPENITVVENKNNRLHELLNCYNMNGRNAFTIQTLAKLQTEYDEIIPNKDNILIRQDILRMIAELQSSVTK